MAASCLLTFQKLENPYFSSSAQKCFCFYVSPRVFKVVYLTGKAAPPPLKTTVWITVQGLDGEKDEKWSCVLSGKKNFQVFFCQTRMIHLRGIPLLTTARDYLATQAQSPPDSAGTPTIHRTLLYDDDFPSSVKEYMEQIFVTHTDSMHVLWTKEDVIQFLLDDPEEFKIFMTFSNIQRSDFVRYLLMRDYGGIYIDFDIKPQHADASLKPYWTRMMRHPTTTSVLFVEHVWDAKHKRERDQPIRNGVPEDIIRVANFIFICKPQSPFIHDMIALVKQRSGLEVNTQYDILYTTGPDIPSTIFGEWLRNQKNLLREQNATLVDKNGWTPSFSHQCDGHWRK